MLYLSRPRGTHAVFAAERDDWEYPGAFDIVKLEPGTNYTSGYPAGSFVGNRETLDGACEWADICDESTRHRLRCRLRLPWSRSR